MHLSLISFRFLDERGILFEAPRTGLVKKTEKGNAPGKSALIATSLAFFIPMSVLAQLGASFHLSFSLLRRV